MQQPITRAVGGAVLVGSAAVLAAAIILQSDAPASLAAYRADASTLGSLLMALAGLLWIAGAMVLARNFDGTRSEIWATLGYGSAIFAAVALFAGGAIQGFGYFGLATGTILPHTEEAFTALAYTTWSLGFMGMAAYFAAVACFGAAMLGTGWPRWMGWSGIAIGGAIVTLNVLFVAVDGIGQELIAALSMIGLIWVAVAGWTLHGMGREAPARERPGVAAGL